MNMYRKWIRKMLLVLLVLTTMVLPVMAAGRAGAVLYHQDFSVVSTASIAGIRRGTKSSENTVIAVAEDALGLYSTDDRRAYALLPEIEWTDEHTIEFSFRFTDELTSRGYLSFLLTCWDEEPNNISAVVFRVDGTIDDFSEPSAAMQNKIRYGELIHVKIPVDDGMVYTVELQSGNVKCSVQRETVMLIAAGNRGFGVRNASAEVTEIYVVNGTGYSAKTGTYAEKSWADDGTVYTGEVVSPPTGDACGIVLALGLSGITAFWAKRRKNRA